MPMFPRTRRGKFHHTPDFDLFRSGRVTDRGSRSHAKNGGQRMASSTASQKTVVLGAPKKLREMKGLTESQIVAGLELMRAIKKADAPGRAIEHLVNLVASKYKGKLFASSPKIISAANVRKVFNQVLVKNGLITVRTKGGRPVKNVTNGALKRIGTLKILPGERLVAEALIRFFSDGTKATKSISETSKLIAKEFSGKKLVMEKKEMTPTFVKIVFKEVLVANGLVIESGNVSRPGNRNNRRGNWEKAATISAFVNTKPGRSPLGVKPIPNAKRKLGRGIRTTRGHTRVSQVIFEVLEKDNPRTKEDLVKRVFERINNPKMRFGGKGGNSELRASHVWDVYSDLLMAELIY